MAPASANAIEPASPTTVLATIAPNVEIFIDSLPPTGVGAWPPGFAGLGCATRRFGTQANGIAQIRPHGAHPHNRQCGGLPCTRTPSPYGNMFGDGIISR